MTVFLHMTASDRAGDAGRLHLESGAPTGRTSRQGAALQIAVV
jgi:hypothetical protein